MLSIVITIYPPTKGVLEVCVFIFSFTFLDAALVTKTMRTQNLVPMLLYGDSPSSGDVWKESKFQFLLQCDLFHQVPRGYISSQHDLLDISVNGHVIHGSGMKSPAFRDFLAQYPAWSYPVGWTASYKMYKFWTHNHHTAGCVWRHTWQMRCDGATSTPAFYNLREKLFTLCTQTISTSAHDRACPCFVIFSWSLWQMMQQIQTCPSVNYQIRPQK